MKRYPEFPPIERTLGLCRPLVPPCELGVLTTAVLMTAFFPIRPFLVPNILRIRLKKAPRRLRARRSPWNPYKAAVLGIRVFPVKPSFRKDPTVQSLHTVLLIFLLESRNYIRSTSTCSTILTLRGGWLCPLLGKKGCINLIYLPYGKMVLTPAKKILCPAIPCSPLHLKLAKSTRPLTLPILSFHPIVTL